MKLGFGSSLPTGVTAGSTDETTVSITDDDVPSRHGQISNRSLPTPFQKATASAVKVVLSADPERTVTVPRHFKTNQGGATAADYSIPTVVSSSTAGIRKRISPSQASSANRRSVNDDGER